MADWPRDIDPAQVTRIQAFAGERAGSQGGPVQRRTIANRGHVWSETYPWLKSGRSEDENLLATIEHYHHQMSSFQIDHLLLPGSGKDPNGSGTSGVTVSGAGQTGSSLDTTGWPVSTSDVVVAGDVIKVAGFDHIHRITANADSDGSGDATLSINPPIYTGEDPNDGDGITTTDVKLTAMIWSVDGGKSAGADYYAGISVTFRELP